MENSAARGRARRIGNGAGRRALAILILACPLALSGAAVAADASLEPGVDYHSFANLHQFRVGHLALDLRADFITRSLAGSVELSVTRLVPQARTLVLDTRNLDVRAVFLVQNDRAVRLEAVLGAASGPLGQPLQVRLPDRGIANEFVVRIEYATRPDASGLQWLEPRMTAGKKHPFLFSQSQVIHARSWIPLQDSPQVRATYRASIRTPAGLRAVMGAASVGDGPSSESNGERVYRFHMPQAIPSYLIAIAIGDLQFADLGPRSGVYAEPAMLAAAAREFADLERMLTVGEGLLGPYRWERHDLLVLPPSFPMGGMENPRLSFITPTVIAGDRSLVSLVVHELAHSWSGNLVTNATWRDMWLNEGFTVYFERRLVEALYGDRREQMEATLGLQTLRRELAVLAPDEQRLAIDLRGRDPDEGITSVPYEKGSLFLRWLESRAGRAKLDAFLRGYFDRFAFTSITTEQFLDHLRAELLTASPDVATDAQLAEWLFEPGLPAFAVLPSSDALFRIDELRESWLAGKIATASLPVQRWTTHEWLHFLSNLPHAISRAQFEALDRAFALSTSPNSEIAHCWLVQAIRNAYEPAYPALERYLISVGRRKLIRPLYQELMKTPRGTALARRIYEQARPGYHPIVVATLDEIVRRAS